jgi:hypothetical protein
MSKNRTIENRESEMRHDYSMLYDDPLSVPYEVRDPNKSFHWARLFIKGDADYSGVEGLARKGWSLVKRVKGSEIDLDPLGRNPLAKEYYVSNDVVLMSIDKKVRDERDKSFYHLNDSKLRIKGVSHDSLAFTKPSISSF